MCQDNAVGDVRFGLGTFLLGISTNGGNLQRYKEAARYSRLFTKRRELSFVCVRRLYVHVK
jgi:hypothetical protein